MKLQLPVSPANFKHINAHQIYLCEILKVI